MHTKRFYFLEQGLQNQEVVRLTYAPFVTSNRNQGSLLQKTTLSLMSMIEKLVRRKTRRSIILLEKVKMNHNPQSNKRVLWTP